MVNLKEARAAILKTNFPLGYEKVNYDSNYANNFSQDYDIRK